MLDRRGAFEYLGAMKPTDTFLDTFSVYAFARNLGTTCLEQMVLSYLLTADDLLKKDNGVHALPVQALADLNGCQNRTVYTALTKLEGKGHIHVEKQASNASPPMVRLTITVPNPRGLFMSIPLVPSVLDEPKRPKTDRGIPAYEKKVGEYNRSVLVSRLTGTAMLAYHAVRTVCHSIPATKAAAKGRKATNYGRLIGTIGLQGWIPGTEKTLGAVLGSLVNAKLLWRKAEPARSNKMRTVYSYTIAPATDFQGMAPAGDAKGQAAHASQKTKSSKPATVRSWEECTAPRPMESLEDLRRELRNNTYYLEHKVNVGIKRLELLEAFDMEMLGFVEPEEEERFKAQVEEDQAILDKEKLYVKNAYQPQHTTEELRALAEKFQAGQKELKSLDTLATAEGMLERNQKELKEREGKLPGWLQLFVDATNALIQQHAKAESPTPKQMKDAIMANPYGVYPFSLLWIAEQQGILDNKMLEQYGDGARESLDKEPLAAVYVKLNSRFGRLLDILEGRVTLPEDEPEPEEEPAEQAPTFQLLEEWLQMCLRRNKIVLEAKAGCSDWSQPAVREIVLTGKIPCYAIPLLYSCNEAGCLDREILSAWRQRALGELSRMSDDLLQEVRRAPALQGILEAIMEDNAPPVTEVTENSGKGE